MTILSKKKTHNKTEEKTDSAHQNNHNHGLSLNTIQSHPQVLEFKSNALPNRQFWYALSFNLIIVDGY